MTNLDSILKSRGISLPTKVRIVKLWIFSVVMYGSEIWTIKAENQIIMFSRYGAGESPLDSKEIKPVNPKGNKP